MSATSSGNRVGNPGQFRATGKKGFLQTPRKSTGLIIRGGISKSLGSISADLPPNGRRCFIKRVFPNEEKILQPKMRIVLLYLLPPRRSRQNISMFAETHPTTL